MGVVILQKIRKHQKDEYALAEKYYGILSVLNNLKLTEREIQLVAYTAVKGNITLANARDGFCRRYGSSFPTIHNIISKLKKKGIFVKENGRVKVNPQILLEFNNGIVLEIHLENDEK